MTPPARRRETTLIAAGRPDHVPGGPVNVPLELSSTFYGADPSAGAGSRVYLRSDGSATWGALEEVLGELDGGTATVFSSGMAAVSAVLDGVPVGGRVVLPGDCYHGVGALLDAAPSGRWEVQRVEVTDTGSVVAAAQGADLLWLESPTNPLMEVADLPALCRAGREAGAVVAVDSTFTTPLLQRPLDLGADVVVHSATKFLGGHSDLLLGVTVAADDARATSLRERRGLAGATPGALEAFLCLRGVRTLALRVEQGQRSAQVLAERLAAHPGVVRVRYPGLPDDPGHARAAAQMAGAGAVLSFELADAAAADAACAAVRLVHAATSLGGVETLMERRSRYPGQGHVPGGLLRLSVGCEHVEDLWADLAQALPG